MGQANRAVMRQLLIFLKEPTPGKVKTRLAASVGDAAACDLYQYCAELTLERLRPLRPEIVLYVDPPHAISPIAQWVGEGWALQPQRGTTLGARMADATARAFAGGARRVVVIGTDSPWLAPSDLEAAFAALDQHDAVIGPTDDGGYYLIGLSRALPALFDEVAWSSPMVYAQTMERAQRSGAHVAALPLGYDVDRIEDVARLLGDARLRPAHAAVLQTIEAAIPSACQAPRARGATHDPPPSTRRQACPS